MRIGSIYTPLVLAVLLIPTSHLVAQDEIYRWVDKDGVLHFGDQLGEQADAELVEIQPPPENINNPYTEPSSAEDDDSEPSYAQRQRDERARKRQEAAQREEYDAFVCDQARKIKAEVEPMPRVIVTREDGTSYRMDDNDRLQKLAEANRLIAEHCDD
jgi:hypothetical protein